MSFGDLFSSARRAARKRIEQLIREGMLPLDEIAFEVSLALDEEVPDERLKEMVAESWNRLSMDISKLSRPTSLERLQVAFDTLERTGIMARHYPSSDRSDALALIVHELALARQSGGTYRGYCFYDRPARREESDHPLVFCFGPTPEPKTYGELWRQQAAIATEVVGSLRTAGFHVEWSGRPADVVFVGGTKWLGPRDSSGVPTVPTGARLEGEVSQVRQDSESGTPANIFVSCSAGSADAHRLISAVAHATESSLIYGSIERFKTDPAAVAVQLGNGMLLDLVAGESDPGPQALLRRRDLANECSFLVAMASDVGKLDCPWWSMYPAERRILVTTGSAGVSAHEGSPVQSLDLASGQGLAELFRAIDRACRDIPDAP